MVIHLGHAFVGAIHILETRAYRRDSQRICARIYWKKTRERAVTRECSHADQVLRSADSPVVEPVARSLIASGMLLVGSPPSELLRVTPSAFEMNPRTPL